MCLKCESGSSRFQPGEGPSRGLLRNYEPTDGPSFEALVFRAAPYNWLVARHTLAQDLESGRQGRSFAGEIRAP